MLVRLPLHVFLSFTLIAQIHAWDNEELELFDLVEEVNANFYDVLGVEQVISRRKSWLSDIWGCKTLISDTST